VLAGFVATFGAMKNPPPGTYGHPKGDDFPASAWLLDLEVRGSDLWALCEFTAKAAEAIRAGEYRFCSIEFALEHLGRESGKPAGPIITKLGLTNIPFIDGLTPITLSLVGASAPQTRSLSAMDPKKIFAAIASALGMGKDSPPDQLKTAVDAFLALFAATIGKPIAEVAAPKDEAALSALTSFAAQVRGVIALADGDPVVPGAGEPLPADAEMAGKCAIADKLMEATGLDVAATMTAVEQNLDALVAVLTAGPSGTGLAAKDGALQLSLVQRSNAALGARVVQLSAEVATLSAGNAEREAKIKSDAIAAEFLRLRDVTGHVIEDMRGDFTAYAMSAGIDAATKIFGRGPAPGTTPLVTGPNAPKVKAPGADADDAPIDDTDPAVKVYRLAYGRGPDADKSIRRVLALSAR
jgi:phage I-like protein